MICLPEALQGDLEKAPIDRRGRRHCQGWQCECVQGASFNDTLGETPLAGLSARLAAGRTGSVGLQRPYVLGQAL